MHGLLFIALGGAIGALARFGITNLTYKITNLYFPWGTICVNLLGCFLIGLLWGFFDNFDINSHLNIRMLLFVGFLGAFTTFSTFALENLSLYRTGEFQILAANILISNIGGLILVFAGFGITRYLAHFFSK